MPGLLSLWEGEVWILCCRHPFASVWLLSAQGVTCYPPFKQRVSCSACLRHSSCDARILRSCHIILRVPFFFLCADEEKAQQKARRDKEAREARLLRIERSLRLVEQRALAEQGQVLREVDLLVHKPADASLGASFLDVSTMDWNTKQDHTISLPPGSC